MIGKKNGMKPTEEVQNGKLSRFAIAGQDKKFVCMLIIDIFNLKKWHSIIDKETP